MGNQCARPGIAGATPAQQHPFTPHPLRMLEGAVYGISPPDERSFFNLESGS
ncbi:hypothetical protein AB0J27_15395 [Micromonospora chokoriensis]